MQWNCRGLRGKLPEIQHLVNDLDLLCLQETLLTVTTNISLNGFSIIRSDMVNQGERGICIIIHKSITFRFINLDQFLHNSWELLAISIPFLNSNLLIINVYRHPNQSTPVRILKELFDFCCDFEFFLLVGDLNAHHHAWNCANSDKFGEDLINLIELNNINILNDGNPTRFSFPLTSQSVIDLSLASSQLAPICNVRTLDDQLGSDHFPISILIAFCNKAVNRINLRIKLNKDELTALCRELEPPLDMLFSGSTSICNAADKYERLIAHIHQTISKISSQSSSGKSSRVSSNRKSPSSSPWWNDTCSGAVRDRKLALATYKRFPSYSNFLEYKKKIAECKKILLKEKRTSWKQFCTNFNSKTPTGEIWKLIKAFKNKNFAPPPDADKTEQLFSAAISKLCPLSCAPPPLPSVAEMKEEDHLLSSCHHWLENPISWEELSLVLKNLKTSSCPGLDGIDNKLILSFPEKLLKLFLSIFNQMLEEGSFPPSWHKSVVIFIPKNGGSGLRPISLNSCLLKILEKCLYNRMAWLLESGCVLPDSQFGFRKFRSCHDNLIILTNYIHKGFLNGLDTAAVFLDINSAFDNVVPSVLINQLKDLGIPAKVRKFIGNLLHTREISFINNGTLSNSLYSFKGTPQGSMLSPILFNIFIKNISNNLHPEVKILQYADDVVIFSHNRSLLLTYDFINLSLDSIHNFLAPIGLEVSPLKSSYILFSKKRIPPLSPYPIVINGHDIPRKDNVRFLGVLLDSRLNGKPHLLHLINKGRKVADILTSLAGVSWGAHPSSLITIYRAVFRSSLEYGCLILKLNGNKSLFSKLQRAQYRILRNALGFRCSTPINVILEEAKEPPLNFRFSYTTSKYLIKQLSLKFNPVIHSYNLLQESLTSVKKISAAKLNIPSLHIFNKLLDPSKLIHRSSFLPIFQTNFQALIHRPRILFLNIPDIHLLPNSSINAEFNIFLSKNFKDDLAIYTDGSKSADLDFVGAALYIPTLNFCLQHKLPPETSIFSAEAWAILQALIFIKDSNSNSVVIFSDSKSVLDTILSHNLSHDNYIILRIREKLHELSAQISITLVWVPAHKGISGNERVDSLAKQAASHGSQPKFRTPYPDLFCISKAWLKEKTHNFHLEYSINKGTFHFTNFHTDSSTPWFHRKALCRNLIVLINRMRSNHYNLNHSLARKNFISSGDCPCGESRQDLNHFIFRCNITRNKAAKLFKYLKEEFPMAPVDIFPLIKNPPFKLCRLLHAFFKSTETTI